jgi:hypothetical protein
VKRRIALNLEERSSGTIEKKTHHSGACGPQQKKKKKDNDIKTASKDKFTVKTWIKFASKEGNSLIDIAKDHPQKEIIIADAKNLTEKGVPYGFAAIKKGQKFSITENSIQSMQNFLQNKKIKITKEAVFFGAFVEFDQPPIIFGTQETIKKTGADCQFLEYLLQPQKITEENFQLQARSLFQCLLDAISAGNRYPYFSKKLREYSQFDDVAHAQEELVIDASSLINTFFLKTFLERGVSPNSSSPETGVWAVTVAKRHQREETLKLLGRYGANLNVEETEPLA